MSALLRTTGMIAALTTLLASSGCGGSGIPAAQWQQRIKQALNHSVDSQQASAEQSRMLQQALDDGALSNMTRSDVQMAIGKGRACRNELCNKHGFVFSDWYYELGVAEGDQVKQLPVLIVGFDHKDRATRIWNLTTH